MAYSGKYKPKNPAKYRGDPTNIVYRSLKERQVMVYFDKCPNILKWSSEDVIVPYLYRVDNKMHRYFVDFTAIIKTESGKVRKLLIEYKPYCQTIQPSKSKKETRKSKNRFIKESLVYIKNINKWEAADKWAKKNNMEFVVITERDTKDMEFFKRCIKGL